MNYAPLRGMNTLEAFQVLSLFGVQDAVPLLETKASSAKDRMILDAMAPMAPVDQKERRCSSARCVPAVDYICMSSC